MDWLKQYFGAAVNSAIGFGLVALSIYAPTGFVDAHRTTLLLAGLAMLGVGTGVASLENKMKVNQQSTDRAARHAAKAAREAEDC